MPSENYLKASSTRSNPSEPAPLAPKEECPGWGSNPHGPFGPRDFKSDLQKESRYQQLLPFQSRTNSYEQSGPTQTRSGVLRNAQLSPWFGHRMGTGKVRRRTGESLHLSRFLTKNCSVLGISILVGVLPFGFLCDLLYVIFRQAELTCPFNHEPLVPTVWS